MAKYLLCIFQCTQKILTSAFFTQVKNIYLDLCGQVKIVIYMLSVGNYAELQAHIYVSCWNMGGPKQCIFSKTAMSTLNVKHLALWGGQVKVGSASWIGILLALLETWLKKYFKHCEMAAITISRNFIKCKMVAITITVKSLLFVGYQFSWVNEIKNPTNNETWKAVWHRYIAICCPRVTSIFWTSCIG